MKVLVLCGGPSSERNVSLVSGNAVATGLRNVGHDVHVADISPEDMSPLDQPIDVVFPVMHGRFGESGELQEALESRGIPYVGSDSSASRLGINKVRCKIAWRNAGLTTPDWRVASAEEGVFPIPFTPPCVVKPTDNGSSIDVVMCRNKDEVKNAAEGLVRKYGTALIETFVKGVELTYGFVEDHQLPPIQIIPKREFYDFQAKYEDRATEYKFDLDLDRTVVNRAAEAAQRAYEIVGCRDLGRVDLIVDREGNACLLEINTLPGFTPTSLLPRAAQRAGMEFNTLVDVLIKTAHSRSRMLRVQSHAV
jgi:D-alanine-D-alanine ligase